jgi:hypothetical protein
MRTPPDVQLAPNPARTAPAQTQISSAPVLGVTSPTPECGKTTAQCHRPPAAAIEQRDGPGGVPRRGEVEADAPDR